MSASPNGFDNDPKRASEAGKKSRKKGIEQQVQEFLEKYWKDGDERTRLDLIYEALLKFGLKGNVKALEVLLDRGYGKAKNINENRDVTLEDNPMYQQLKSMTDKFREDK